MLNWLLANWGNILIVGLVAAFLVGVVVAHIRAKKQGKSSCSCGCSACAMQGACHAAKKQKTKED